MSNHKFQVNLRGIIELLSQHLYSSPEVYIRELLQNAVDAIQARRLYRSEDFVPEINFHFTFENGSPVLRCRDNGRGLDEAEAHEFLSIIGLSSKTEDIARQRGTFIGQFGIGLLSGFMVSDEIKVITRSAKPDSPVVEWRGHQNGTYSVRQINCSDFVTGTEVTLYGNERSEIYFSPERINHLLKLYGEFLPEKITMTSDYNNCPPDYHRIFPPDEIINARFTPWRTEHLSTAQQRVEWMNYARNSLRIEPFDCFPLQASSGKVSGVAFVHSHAYVPNNQQNHQVYLKGMLLNERLDNLLPSSAFFVTCVINAGLLSPTASRESFQENNAYFAAKEELSECVENYCNRLVSGPPAKLQQFLNIHQSGIKHLSAFNERLYAMFCEHLSFETTQGTISLTEYRCRSNDKNTIHYTASVDDFRQLRQMAQAQSMTLINAGYTNDLDLIEKLPDFFPEIRLEKITAERLEEKFDSLCEHELEQSADLLETANQTLQPFGCKADIRKFYPAEIPAIYSLSEGGSWMRSTNEMSNKANELWGEIMSNLQGEESFSENTYARLCLNFSNPVIKKLCAVENQQLLASVVEILYVQALLAGHHNLSGEEQNLLNNCLKRLIKMSFNDIWSDVINEN
ncbi:MAG TPA: HSP90 family protein [Pyrinomonadaceae bacterium]|nr:HSP90 family protein [Pyrinomonadaceae bacterium]